MGGASVASDPPACVPRCYAHARLLQQTGQRGGVRSREARGVAPISANCQACWSPHAIGTPPEAMMLLFVLQPPPACFTVVGADIAVPMARWACAQKRWHAVLGCDTTASAAQLGSRQARVGRCQ